ncbi:restriction endonuclease S subunit [Methanococcus maripaludis]|uniref:Restriction endonuclease S subunit n=1 Tax=Methanococcus maripaludis TaxID=39152 RepID=A0A7J9S777_METMI|nr:restriction endonuclease subunit S [Methanococcus maripaludis]MBB6402661.1 restriction endonuclease S subunit [Methanococcus maripaludis]
MARAMKDSGIEWIGDIPADWPVTRISRYFDIKAGGDLDIENYSPEFTDIHKYPIYTNKKSRTDVYGYTAKPRYSENTITVTGRGDVGIAFYRETKYDAIIRLLVLSPKNDSMCKYFEYFINSCINVNVGSSAINQLSTQQLGPYMITIPPLGEQQQIANYLDELDRRLADKKKWDELFKIHGGVVFIPQKEPVYDY